MNELYGYEREQVEWAAHKVDRALDEVRQAMQALRQARRVALRTKAGVAKDKLVALRVELTGLLEKKP